jgi:predicted PolB exonuclease-like 3'-5' exonuclease
MSAFPPADAAYLVFDAESVPDGKLLNMVKYPQEPLTTEEAVARAQAQARRLSATGSDFLPVTFQYPVALCGLWLGADFRPLAVACLDAPHYRPRQIVEEFWTVLQQVPQRPTLVTFNGRGFDLPLLELAAYRYGLSLREYFQSGRKRFESGHLDLMDWLSNFGAIRMSGGLNLLCKLLGKPGKMEVTGNKIYPLFLRGEHQLINDYCLFDTLDTYFVFLRTRVLTGELSLSLEQQLLQDARQWLLQQGERFPALREYLANWGDWQPWP